MLDKLKRDADSCKANMNEQPKKKSRDNDYRNRSGLKTIANEIKTYSNANSNTNNYNHNIRDHSSTFSSSRPFPHSTSVSKIYLVCPPNVQTGGPEAMHQLCHKINYFHHEKGCNEPIAYMIYLREGADSRIIHARNARVLPAYATVYSHLRVAPSLPWRDIEENDQNNSSYGNMNIVPGLDIAEEEKLDDGNSFMSYWDGTYSDSLVIWPECWTHLIDSLWKDRVAFRISQQQHHNENATTSKSKPIKIQMHQTAIWWLSVDNNNSKFKQWKERTDILHLYQSEYAKQYIMKNLDINLTIKSASHLSTSASAQSSSIDKNCPHNVLPMTEFIPDRRPQTDFSIKRDLEVLYNPLKGMHYTDEILKRSGKKFKFSPIGGGPDGRERISPSDVTKMLHRTKVYIDFGPHPGMDRLPREAALAECIIITNTEGAAKFEQDVPIPSKYKMKEFKVDAIHALLNESLKNYTERVKDFSDYRKWINSQEERMDTCVKTFLERVTTRT